MCRNASPEGHVLDVDLFEAWGITIVVVCAGFSAEMFKYK
jgi:hypothetical protein